MCEEGLADFAAVGTQDGPDTIKAARNRYEEKHALFREMQPRFRPRSLANVERAHRLNITFTSNAIEGNTLTAAETAEVVEKGITIGGKPLKDHLEAVDHAKALDWVIEVGAKSVAPISESDIRNLHHLVLARADPEIAGRYADSPRMVNTNLGLYRFPPPFEIPALMHDFAQWLSASPSTPDTAFEAHRRFVGIHPFNDGNGRVGRLLMNLILVRGDYPPIAIGNDERPAYLHALEIEQRGGGPAAFDDLMGKLLEATLDLYIDAARQAIDAKPGSD